MDSVSIDGIYMCDSIPGNTIINLTCEAHCDLNYVYKHLTPNLTFILIEIIIDRMLITLNERKLTDD